MLGHVLLFGKPAALIYEEVDLHRRPIVDEDAPKKPTAHEVGMPLDFMSVEELNDRIALLQGEIERLKSAIEARGGARKAAESVFKI